MDGANALQWISTKSIVIHWN